ncbi:hypothetical protein ZWY2020_059389 [Hordeum vulgare]|nr:hypothetical protein ZWY2020_059389 [Hordeum vulgare]
MVEATCGDGQAAAGRRLCKPAGVASLRDDSLDTYWHFNEKTEKRYNPNMSLVIRKDKWKKGSQWVMLIRKHAEVVVGDKHVFQVFRKHYLQESPSRPDRIRPTAARATPRQPPPRLPCPPPPPVPLLSTDWLLLAPAHSPGGHHVATSHLLHLRADASRNSYEVTDSEVADLQREALHLTSSRQQHMSFRAEEHQLAEHQKEQDQDLRCSRRSMTGVPEELVVRRKK